DSAVGVRARSWAPQPSLNEMKDDPLSGDVVLLRGEYHGLYRRRVGPWRIIFGLRPDHDSSLSPTSCDGPRPGTEGKKGGRTSPQQNGGFRDAHDRTLCRPRWLGPADVFAR